jgi:hypothetical protein
MLITCCEGDALKGAALYTSQKVIKFLGCGQRFAFVIEDGNPQNIAWDDPKVTAYYQIDTD